jgi:lysophospholipase L1-like esterase
MDLYAQDDTGKWRYAGITCFNSLEEIESKWPTLEHNLVDVPLKPGKRMYMLNLPLYNGVSDVQIGVETGAYFRGVQTRQEKPIVFYGTSITHGCCASRPGMNFVSILGRRLDMPVLNLGFAGEAFMDIEIAQLLNELDPSVYVIDCLPNMIEKMVQERCEPFIKEIRNSHPQTPIVLVEDRTATNTIFLPEQQERHRTSRRALRQAYENLLKAGIERLTYIEGERLLGNDGEGAVDGSHPTDLGFMRMADAFEPVLRNLTTCKS